MILVFGRAQQVHEDDFDNEETHHLHKVTVILELLQHKINIDAPHRLLPTLFATLARYISSSFYKGINHDYDGVWISDLSKFSAPTIAFLAF